MEEYDEEFMIPDEETMSVNSENMDNEDYPDEEMESRTPSDVLLYEVLSAKLMSVTLAYTENTGFIQTDTMDIDFNEVDKSLVSLAININNELNECIRLLRLRTLYENYNQVFIEENEIKILTKINKLKMNDFSVMYNKINKDPETEQNDLFDLKLNDRGQIVNWNDAIKHWETLANKEKTILNRLLKKEGYRPNDERALRYICKKYGILGECSYEKILKYFTTFLKASIVEMNIVSLGSTIKYIPMGQIKENVYREYNLDRENIVTISKENQEYQDLKKMLRKVSVEDLLECCKKFGKFNLDELLNLKGRPVVKMVNPVKFNVLNEIIRDVDLSTKIIDYISSISTSTEHVNEYINNLVFILSYYPLINLKFKEGKMSVQDLVLFEYETIQLPDRPLDLLQWKPSDPSELPLWNQKVDEVLFRINSFDDEFRIWKQKLQQYPNGNIPASLLNETFTRFDKVSYTEFMLNSLNLFRLTLKSQQRIYKPRVTVRRNLFEKLKQRFQLPFVERVESLVYTTCNSTKEYVNVTNHILPYLDENKTTEEIVLLIEQYKNQSKSIPSLKDLHVKELETISKIKMTGKQDISQKVKDLLKSKKQIIKRKIISPKGKLELSFKQMKIIEKQKMKINNIGPTCYGYIEPYTGILRKAMKLESYNEQPVMSTEVVYSGLNNVWYEVTFPVHNSQKGVWFYVTTEYDAKNPRLINNVFKMVKLGTVNTYPIHLIGQRIIK